MRGNPILRVIFLIVALALTGALVAAVVHNRSLPAESNSPEPDSGPDASLVPAYLTLTLSAPATSLTLTEPGGRVITIPASSSLTIEHECELTLSNNSYQADLTVNWVDPAGPKFLHLELEPDNFPTREVTLHPTGPSHPIQVNFAN